MCVVYLLFSRTFFPSSTLACTYPSPLSHHSPTLPPLTSIPHFVKHRLPSTFSQHANLNPLVCLPANAQIAHSHMLCCHINVFFSACICHSSGMWCCKWFLVSVVYCARLYFKWNICLVLRRPHSANRRCVLLFAFSKTMQGEVLNCRRAHPLTHGWILKTLFFLISLETSLLWGTFRQILHIFLIFGWSRFIFFRKVGRTSANHVQSMREPCANHVRTRVLRHFRGCWSFLPTHDCLNLPLSHLNSALQIHCMWSRHSGLAGRCVVRSMSKNVCFAGCVAFQN